MTSLMLQGTASGVGKSVLVAGLCRLLARAGVRVAPFKPQNMSNNAAVTADGGEIGRAQALQALAAGIEPVTDLNPVLLKPEADQRAQLIVNGQVAGRLAANRFREDRRRLLDPVLAAYERLRSRYDVVLVEGAGSPAEPNLMEGDIANMGFARSADVPVWLVGDIDRGGVFAALFGTLALLPPTDAARVEAFIINRFRGSPGLLQDAVEWLQARTGKPVAGVMPLLPDLALPEEDSPYRMAAQSGSGEHKVRAAVLALPRASNIDDVDPLAGEPGVEVCFIRRPEALEAVDLLILPGSKHVASDLAWLREQGFEAAIRRFLRYGGRVLGICGGYQMLGETVHDPDAVEGDTVEGLGLLSVESRLVPTKRLARVENIATWPESARVTGYEIHHGHTWGQDAVAEGFPFSAASPDGRILGTYVHGFLNSGPFRRALLKRWLDLEAGEIADQDTRTLAALDQLADALDVALGRHLDRLRNRGARQI